jgi:hypothetical protein
MDVSALVVQELELDGSISTQRMAAEPGHRLTVAFADEFTDPRSGPFHFTAERNEKAFAEGFANRYVRKLSESLFSVSGDEYHLELPWQGRQRNYALSLPEFAVPSEIRVTDPRSNKPLYKYVVRDDQRNRFVIYINRQWSRADFDFVLVARFRIWDRKQFLGANIRSDKYMSRYGNRSDANSDSDTLELQISLFPGPSTEGTQQDGERPRRAKRRARPQTAAEHEREVKIRRVIREGKKGIFYSRELDHKDVEIPRIWVSKGCPETYEEAYLHQDPRWRKYITNEKWSIGRRLSKS